MGEDAGQALEIALLARATSETIGDEEALDSTLGKKVDDPRCAHRPDGQKCVNSTDLIHCMKGKRIVGSESNCETQKGRLSLCLVDGVAPEEREYCDDPFCRNGAAYDGDTVYCHNSKVVRCSGPGQPQVLDGCSSSTTRNTSGCDVTTRYMCMNLGGPQCEVRDHVASCGDGKAERRFDV